RGVGALGARQVVEEPVGVLDAGGDRAAAGAHAQAVDALAGLVHRRQPLTLAAQHGVGGVEHEDAAAVGELAEQLAAAALGVVQAGQLPLLAGDGVIHAPAGVEDEDRRYWAVRAALGGLLEHPSPP